MPKKSGFRGERMIEFWYLKRGDQWRLVKKHIDAEVKRVVGIAPLRMPRVIDSPFMPPKFLLELYAALAVHRMEANKIGAFYGLSEGGQSYRVEITIRERRSRPKE
jgi:hypothetical protein